MLSAILMLRHLGQDEVANRVEQAIHHAYSECHHLTRDVGGAAATDEFTSALVGSLQ
jgi:isocitrate dehydrogenase (NAD+)